MPVVAVINPETGECEPVTQDMRNRWHWEWIQEACKVGGAWHGYTLARVVIEHDEDGDYSYISYVETWNEPTPDTSGWCWFGITAYLGRETDGGGVEWTWADSLWGCDFTEDSQWPEVGTYESERDLLAALGPDGEYLADRNEYNFAQWFDIAEHNRQRRDDR